MLLHQEQRYCWRKQSPLKLVVIYVYSPCRTHFLWLFSDQPPFLAKGVIIYSSDCSLLITISSMQSWVQEYTVIRACLWERSLFLMKVVKEEKAFLPRDSIVCKVIDPWVGKPSLIRRCDVADTLKMIEGQDRKSQSPSDITKPQNQPWAHPVGKT